MSAPFKYFLLLIAMIPLAAWSQDASDDAIELHGHGVADDTIVEWAHHQKPINPTRENVLKLHDAGVSDEIIKALLSGDTVQKGNATADAVQAPQSAPPAPVEELADRTPAIPFVQPQTMGPVISDSVIVTPSPLYLDPASLIVVDDSPGPCWREPAVFGFGFGFGCGAGFGFFGSDWGHGHDGPHERPTVTGYVSGTQTAGRVPQRPQPTQTPQTAQQSATSPRIPAASMQSAASNGTPTSAGQSSMRVVREMPAASQTAAPVQHREATSSGSQTGYSSGASSHSGYSSGSASSASSNSTTGGGVHNAGNRR